MLAIGIGGVKLKGQNLMANKTRGGKRQNAGRKPPEVAKVRLSTWVLPSTREKLGKSPGPQLDRIVDALRYIAAAELTGRHATDIARAALSWSPDAIEGEEF